MITIFLLSWIWYAFAIVVGSGCWTPMVMEDAFAWGGAVFFHGMEKEATKWLPYLSEVRWKLLG